MRVLLVTSGFGGWFDGFERAVARALAAQGALVVRIPLDRLEGGVSRGFRWDLGLVLGGDLLQEAALLPLRRRCGVLAAWVTEDPYTIDRRRGRWADAFDVVFTNEQAAEGIYPAGRAAYLPWCTDPEAFCPAPHPGAPPGRRTIDVLFVGQGFPNRVRLLNRLAPWLVRWRTVLVGDFDRWGERLHESLRPLVRPPVRDWTALARLYRSANVCINVHREPWDGAIPENRNRHNVPALSPNNRCFDAAAAECLPLVDGSREEALRALVPELASYTFRRPEELVDRLLHLLGDPRERAAAAAAARQRVTRLHTYRHRTQAILARCGLRAQVPPIQAEAPARAGAGSPGRS